MHGRMIRGFVYLNDCINLFGIVFAHKQILLTLKKALRYGYLLEIMPS